MRSNQIICDKCNKEIHADANWSVVFSFMSSLLKLNEQLHFCNFEEMACYLMDKLMQTVKKPNTDMSIGYNRNI